MSTTFPDPQAYPAMTLTAANGETVLVISSDGEITWRGSPSKAASVFFSSLKSTIDIEVIGGRAAERIYRRAVGKCLNMAETMNKDEYIAMLRQELQARVGKAVLMELKRED